MEEMPLSPEDEFLYDSEIHQQVEKAREAVVKLGDLFS
jgi:predicted aconitase